ncbi:MAG TPA: tetratricopeptide repeat protein [Bradyrhizobium sp.]|nr:tetratricopeptide repeat protein [Bradyrhizobium sp.]
MRFSVILAALAASLAFVSPALAQSQSDVDSCRFAGVLSKADEGIAACDRVIDDAKVTVPNRAIALSNRCGWWWTKNDPDRALADCNEAIRADGGNAAAFLNRGNSFFSKSDFEHAFADFNAAIRLDPKNAWAYAARGNLYRTQGEFDRALADLNESIKLDPNYSLAFFARGDLYRSKGDLARAMADMNESLRLDPNYALGYSTRARLSYKLGNNPAAIEDFNKAIKLDPENATAHFNRGVAYYVVGGRIPDAVADFKKAAELNPKDAYAAIWRDLAERRNNAPSHLAEAVKQLDMTAWPAPVIRHLFGELTAEQTLGAAFDTDPRTKQAQTCEANFYSGEFALIQKNKKEAQRLLKLAADDCPPSFVESTAAIAELIQLK